MTYTCEDEMMKQTTSAGTTTVAGATRKTTKTTAAGVATMEMTMGTNKRDPCGAMAITSRKGSLNAHTPRQCRIIIKITGNENDNVAEVEVHRDNTEAAVTAGAQPHQEREASLHGCQ